MPGRKCSLIVLFVCLTATLSIAQPLSDKEGWTLLFNGKDLDGWKKLNGDADFKIEPGGIITGTAKVNTPNTFLCTEKTYGDFILEFDIWVDPRLNSGVQIRSLSRPDYLNGRVHGYQVEVDPSERAYSGGLYDEARRLWLYPITRNKKSRGAFKNGAWNNFHVEAVGNHIKTWVNGVMCTNLVVDFTNEGFIALQVHAVSQEEAGSLVKWKNLRIKTENLDPSFWNADPTVPEISYLTNKLTENEQRHGWRLLWDGKSPDGWRGAKLDHFPEKGWQIKDGILTVLATDGGEATGPGDIITDQVFTDFELELEFMIAEGANSGIKYFVDPELNKGPGSAIGCEFQILDDKTHPDAKMGVGGNRTLASLYDLIASENLSAPSRSKTFNGTGMWNKARIVSKDGHVEHWLNNEKVVEYDRFSQVFKSLVAYSKYKQWPEFGKWPTGHILLQDHGNTVHFRSIKIREL